MPKISIIVPVYNTAPYINTALKSIARQSFHDFEVVLVDDGSTDRSGQICDEWVTKDDRFRVIHQNNGGLSSARNVGIESAGGEFICFCDSDDTYHPQYLELLYSGFLEYPDAEFVMGRREFTKEMILSSDVITNPTIKILTQKDVLREMFSNFQYASVNCKLFRKCAIQNIRFRNTAAEDIDFNMRLFLKTKEFVLRPHILYYYYQRDGSIIHSRKLDLRLIAETEAWKNLYRDFFINCDEETQSYFLTCVYRLVFTRFIQDKGKDVVKAVNQLIDEIKVDFRKNKFIPLKQKMAISCYRRAPWFYLMMKRCYGRLRWAC